MNSIYVVEQKQEVNSKVMAFLEMDVTSGEVENIENRLKAIEGATSVEYFSKEESMKKAMNMGEMFSYGIPEEDLQNLYPPFFRVTFETLDAEKKIIATLQELNGVGSIEQEDKNGNITTKKDIRVTESAEKSIKTAQSIGIIATLAMILIIELSVVIMMNSTKLMLYARRKEISIMKYVGAKDTFVKMPFAIEGIIIALVAAVVVMVVISFAYEPATLMVEERANYNCLTISEVMESLKWILLCVGVVIGTFGSTMSMNKYLDV